MPGSSSATHVHADEFKYIAFVLPHLEGKIVLLVPAAFNIISEEAVLKNQKLNVHHKSRNPSSLAIFFFSSIVCTSIYSCQMCPILTVLNIL